MAGIACTLVARMWPDLRCAVFSGGADPFLFGGSEGRLVYVGRGLAYVMWSGIPSWVIIGSNRRCSSVMETQLTVHHRSN